MASAELALWTRVEGLGSEDVPRAFWEERSLVKTWAMRGTLHLLPALELGLWQTVPRLDRRYRRPSRLRYFGISAEDLERYRSTSMEPHDTVDSYPPIEWSFIAAVNYFCSVSHCQEPVTLTKWRDG